MSYSIDQEAHYEQLRKRRNEVLLTLEHVQGELRAVDDNKNWIDHAAYASRVALLGSLTEWYVKESNDIDNALNRIAAGEYGSCLACKGPIEACRLKATPAAGFCAKCQDMADPFG